MNSKEDEVNRTAEGRKTTDTDSEFYRKLAAEARRFRELGLDKETAFDWDFIEDCRANTELQQAPGAELGRLLREGGVPAVIQFAGRGEAPPEEERLCPYCNASLTWVFLRSPDWTWKKLCGSAGWLAVCPNRCYQGHFVLAYMN